MKLRINTKATAEVELANVERALLHGMLNHA